MSKLPPSSLATGPMFFRLEVWLMSYILCGAKTAGFSFQMQTLLPRVKKSPILTPTMKGGALKDLCIKRASFHTPHTISTCGNDRSMTPMTLLLGWKQNQTPAQNLGSEMIRCKDDFAAIEITDMTAACSSVFPAPPLSASLSRAAGEGPPLTLTAGS